MSKADPLEGLTVSLEHRNRIAWYDIPLPKWWHRHYVQSWGTYMDPFRRVAYVEHCPCGAFRINGEHHWTGRMARAPRLRERLRAIAWIVGLYSFVGVMWIIGEITGI